MIEDQPPPKPNASRPIWELVIEDMQERDRVGRARYGTPLQADNGRDHLVDAYQEALDLAVYLRTEIEERRIRRMRGALDWLCIVCGAVHPAEHEGIFLGSWMACVGCERELSRRHLGPRE